MTLTATEQMLCLNKKLLENLVGKLVSDSYGFPLEKPGNKLKEQLELLFRGILA